MSRRRLAVIFMLAAAAAGSRTLAQTHQGGIVSVLEPAPPLLLEVRSLTDDVAKLLLYEQPDALVVHLYGHSTRQGEQNAKPLSRMTIQVWLLRADGTTLRQLSKDHIGYSNGGVNEDTMNFFFEHSPAKTLAGVVLNINGTWLVRAM